MTIWRDPTKALQIGFLALLVISTAQVLWWVADHATYTREVRDRMALLYDSDAQVVTRFLGEPPSAGELETLLPHLSVQSGIARVRVDAVDALDLEESSRINRYLWEGGFFLVVLLGGMLVLTRTIRDDAELRRRQQNFLAAVSHEFKSPLASMRLAAETLMMRAGEPDTRKLGERILEDGDRLLRMVDNLLDTTRLEEGRHELETEPISVRAMVEAGITELEGRAKANGIEVGHEVPGDLTLLADRAAFESVLRNVLDNAVKACVAGEGHRVNVSARALDGRVELSVSDDGIGFPADDASTIFEKFYRSGEEIRRTTPGSGLGLYIVRKLVELSKGKIHAHSEGPGKGATITVTWPAGTPTDAAP